MKLIKDVILERYNLFFTNLKNNQFNPDMFYDAVSLSHAYLVNYSKSPLTEDEIKVRQLLLEGFTWEALEDSFVNPDDFEEKKEFNIMVKSNYSVNVKEFVELLNQCIIEDEKLINNIFKKFKVDLKSKRRLKIYPDIKQKWSVGIVDENF